MKIVEYNGIQFEFPDDAKEKEIKATIDKWEREFLDTGEGPVETAAKNVAVGVLGTYEAFRRGLQALEEAEIKRPRPHPFSNLVNPAVAAEEHRHAAERVRERIKAINPNPYYRGSFWVEGVPQAIGSSAALLPAAIAGPAGVATAGFLVNGGSAYQEALEAGADEDTALREFFINGLGGITEAIPIAHMFQRINKISKGSVKRLIAETMAQAFEEGAQETFQQGLDNLVSMYGSDPERKLWDGLLKSGAVGAVSGGMMTAVGGGAGLVGRRVLGIEEPAQTPATKPPSEDDKTKKAAGENVREATEQPGPVRVMPEPAVKGPVDEATLKEPGKQSRVWHVTTLDGAEYYINSRQGESFYDALGETQITPDNLGTIEIQSEGEEEAASRLDYAALVREIGFDPGQIKEESIPTPEEAARNVAVADSPIEGRGLFAKREFDSGETIGPAYLDGVRTDTIGLYINHSVTPNAELLEDGTIRALEPIRQGREITVNYREALPVIQKIAAQRKEAPNADQEQSPVATVPVETPAPVQEVAAGTPAPVSESAVEGTPQSPVVATPEPVAEETATETIPPAEPRSPEQEIPPQPIPPETTQEAAPTPPAPPEAVPGSETAGTAPGAPSAPAVVSGGGRPKRPRPKVERPKAEQPTEPQPAPAPTTETKPPAVEEPAQPQPETTAPEPASETGRRPSSETLEEIRKERARLEAELVELLKEVSAGLNPKLFSVVGQLTLTYVKEGVVRFSDFIDRLWNNPTIRANWDKLKSYWYGAWAMVAPENNLEIPTREEAESIISRYKPESGREPVRTEKQPTPAPTPSPTPAPAPATASETLATQPTQVSPPPEAAPKSPVETVKSSGYLLPESEDENWEKGGAVNLFDRNYRALEILVQLQAEARPPTAKEQAELAMYAGWGQSELANKLFYARDTKWQDRLEKLKLLVGSGAVDGFLSSTPNTLYTSPYLARRLWEILRRFGYRGGRALEPASGSGIFLTAMPEDLYRATSWVINDRDRWSGDIAAALHPGAKKFSDLFQDLKLPEQWFDLVISNVPFGDERFEYKGGRHVLHDFFILKSLHLTRPGGLVMIVTSSGTMDKVSSQSRKAMREVADLIFATRLPNGALPWTKVQADVLLFRVRGAGETAGGLDFIESVPFGESEHNVNKLFIEQPSLVLGRMEVGRSMYGPGTDIEVVPVGNWKESLNELISRLKPVMAPEKPRTPRPGISGKPDTLEPLEYLLGRDSSGREIVLGDYGPVLGRKQVHVAANKLSQWTLWLRLKETLGRLVDLESMGELDEANKVRHQLAEDYRSWAAKYGPLTTETPAELKSDPDYYRVLSLEVYDSNTRTAKPADILEKPTINPIRIPDRAGDIKEAVAISLASRGRLDSDYMAGLLGVSRDEAEKQAVESGFAVYLPGGGIESADTYVIGNVREKLAQAKAAAALDPRFNRNVDLLVKVIPPDKPIDLIHLHIGAFWIPNQIRQAFFENITGGFERLSAEWSELFQRWEIKKWSGWGSTFDHVYGTSFASGREVLLSALNGKPIVIRDPETKAVDLKRTATANAKVEQLQKDFAKFVRSHPEHAEVAARAFNDYYNSHFYPNPKGDFLQFPLSGVQPRPHQLAAVARLFINRILMLAHEVGTGKTLIYGMAAYAARRFGLARKPVLAVLKANIAGITNELTRSFPTMRILSLAGEYDARRRKIALNRIPTGDWDLVIVTHDHLNMMDVPVEFERQFIEDKIKQLREYLRTQFASGEDGRGGRGRGKDPTVKRIEKMLLKLEAKLKELLASKRDPEVDFERLGFDMLMVDEAHYYKNLPLQTIRDGVKGIPTQSSQRATGLEMKIKLLRSLHPGAPIVLGTGTPIDNTLAELYVWLQYLLGDRLNKEYRLPNFDAFLNVFSEVYTSFEPGVTGEFRATGRLTYTSLPQLHQLAASSFHVVTLENVPNVRRPKKIERVIESEPNRMQQRMMLWLANRASAVKNGLVEKTEDNYLKIFTDGRKMSVHPGLLLPSGVKEGSPKLDELIRLIKENYRAEPDRTHMIFCDLGVESTPWGFNLYDEIIARLIHEVGIPADQILDFRKPRNNREQNEMVERLNAGQARVAIGSTKRLGTGVNAQRRLKFLYHLDVPFKPGDLFQRDGRGWRQLNENQEVYSYRLVTTRSLDAFMWALIANKAAFIRKFMSGAMVGERYSEQENEEIPPDVIMAMAVGIPEVLEAVKVRHELRELTLSREATRNNRSIWEHELERARYWLKRSEQSLKDTELINKELERHESFEWKIGSQTFTKFDDKFKQMVAAKAIDGLKLLEGETLSLGVYKGVEITAKRSGGGLHIYWQVPGMTAPYERGFVDHRDADAAAQTVVAVSGYFKHNEIVYHQTNIKDLTHTISRLESNPPPVWDEANDRKISELEARLEKLDEVVQKKRMLRGYESADFSDFEREAGLYKPKKPGVTEPNVLEADVLESRQPEIVTGMPVGDVLRQVRRRFGISDRIDVVNVDEAWDGRAVFDGNELVKVQLNASRIRDADQVDRVLLHELSHAVWRSGVLSDALARIPEADRDKIRQTVLELGYDPLKAAEEAQARAVEGLVRAFKERSWFGKVVGVVLAWVERSTGIRLGQRAAEAIAAQALARIERQIAAKDVLHRVYGRVDTVESRTPEEADADEAPLPDPTAKGFVKTEARVADEGVKTIPKVTLDALNKEAWTFVQRFPDTVEGLRDAHREARVINEPLRRQMTLAALEAKAAQIMARQPSDDLAVIIQVTANTLLRGISRAGQDLSAVRAINDILEPSLPVLSLYSPLARALRRKLTETLGKPVDELYQTLDALITVAGRDFVHKLVGAFENNPAALAEILRLLSERPVAVTFIRRLQELREKSPDLSLRELYARRGTGNIADAVMRLLLGEREAGPRAHLLDFDNALLGELRRLTTEIMAELGFQVPSKKETTPEQLAERLALALSEDPLKSQKAELILKRLRERLGDAAEEYDTVLETLLGEYTNRVASRRSARLLIIALARQAGIRWDDVFRRRETRSVADRLLTEAVEAVKQQMSPDSKVPETMRRLLETELNHYIEERREIWGRKATRRWHLFGLLREAFARANLRPGELLRMAESDRQSAWERLKQAVTDALGDVREEDRQAAVKILDEIYDRYRLNEVRREMGRLNFLPNVRHQQALQSAMDRFIALHRLGMFDLDVFAREFARRLGLSVPDNSVFKRLAELGEQLNKARSGYERHRIWAQILEMLRTHSWFSGYDLAKDWWYAAVLGRTSTWANVIVGSLSAATVFVPGAAASQALRGQFKAAAEIVTAFAVGLAHGLRTAAHLVRTGNYAILPDYEERAERELGRYLYGGRQRGATGILEVLDKLDPSVLTPMQKVARALQLKYTHRLMTALDYMFSGAARDALAFHAAHTRKDWQALEQLRKRWDRDEIRRLRAEAEQALGPGASAAEITRWVQDRFEEKLDREAVKVINHLSRRVAQNADLDGAWGMIQRFFERIPFLVKAPFGAAFMRSTLNMAATFSDMMVGAVRAQIGAKAAEVARRDPESPIARWATSPEEQRIQTMLNLMSLGLASVWIWLVLGGDDDEDRVIGLEGPWTTLTPSQKKKLLDEGAKPLSIWVKVGDRKYYFGYRNTPFSPVLTGVGYASDIKRYTPSKYEETATTELIAAAIMAGFISIKDVAPLGQFAYLTGVAANYMDAPEKMAERIQRLLAGTVGRFTTGFIPGLVSEIDQWLDPTWYRTYGGVGEEKVLGYWMRNFPFLRRFGPAKPALNILGEEIQLTVPPLRTYFSAAKGDGQNAWSVLERAASMGIFPIVPGDRQFIIEVDGTAREMTGDEFYEYYRAYGSLLADELEQNAPWLLGADADQLQEFLNGAKNVIRRRRLARELSGTVSLGKRRPASR